jgi:hypothetical protein
MSTKRTIDIEVTLENGDKVIKQFEDLGNGVLKAADSVGNLDAKFEDVFKGVEPLTTRLGEAEDRLYELALAGDTTSKEYQELLTKVGEYRKVQIQTDIAVDAAATTFSQKLAGALTGAASGFAAVQGAIGLVSTESEELNAVLLRVQSALALAQGVQGVKDAAPAFQQLGQVAVKALTSIRNAIGALGVGALVFGITFLVTKFDEIKEILGINNKSLEEQLEIEKKISEEKQKQKSEMEQTIKNNNNHIKRRIEIRKLEEDIKDLSIDQEKNQDEIFEKQKKILDLKELQIGVELNSLEGLLSKEEKVNKEIELAVIGREKRRLIAQREFDLAQQAEKKRQESAAKKKTDEAAEIARQKELAELERQRLENLENLKNQLLDEIAEVEEENFERTLTEQEIEVRAVEEKYFRLINLAEQFGFDTTELEIGRLNELNDINLEFAEKQKKIDDDVAQNKKDNIEAERIATLEGIEKGLEMAEQGAAAIQALGDAVFAHKMKDLEKGSKEEKKVARKQFKFNKALQLGGAVIDAGKAITASLAQSPIAIGPVPNPAGIASLAFAATTSAANIAKIAASRFESPGSASTTPSASGIDGGEPQAPQFNVVGDSGINQLASLQQQPTQAFVVSGEVTTAQALDRNRVQNATL